MTPLLLTLLLQSSLLLPPRTAMENPAAISQVPPKLRKDYDKLWTRFLAAKEDSKLYKDLDKFIQKQKTFDPVWVIQGYLSLYRGDDAAARQKFAQAIQANSNNRIALFYLAELTYAHGEYAQAAALLARLQSIDPNYPEIETKRQKAFLLAADDLLRSAVRAEGENRLGDAEGFYRQAMRLAPNEPALQVRLADLLLKQDRKAESDALRKAAEELMPRRAENVPSAGDGRNDDLESLGRWGGEIEVFHEIRDTGALTRAQFALLLVRYFPQIAEFPQTPNILTDIQQIPARAEIQTVVGAGLIDPLPNHDFEPAAAISRAGAATALARLSRLLGLSTVSGSPIVAPDLTESNAAYAEIQWALGQGVMTLEDSGNFNVSGHLSGQQAVQSSERLLRIFQQAQR